ncbi:right-handed parallel beta-helix repeat-containing protein [Nocardioides sp.]|uniref:right-handed parallel beta-helix repeat-containing protein n=1 Tax=Nocardioides sp. TaxID=35761 RepID=UPI003D09D91D
MGPGRALETPSAASAVARSGDRIEIDAGTYVGDTATWTQDDLTIRGVGGRVHLDAAGRSAQGKGIWVISGARTRIANVEFSGATVPDRNGAGIRQEGAGLVLRNCWFHDNENGILAGANATSDITIAGSRFFRNGLGDGYTHNIYIGAVRSFTLTGSSITTARVGHEVKSRALRNTIRANRILDKQATASYSIDLPNGGDSVIAGNVIEQGPNSENPVLISYGAEGLSNPSARLWVVNNTLVNHRGTGTYVAVAAGSNAHLWNNLLVGPGDLRSGTAQRTANRRVRSGFRDPAAFGFRLRPGSPAINRGVLPPSRARATYEFRAPVGRIARPRIGRVDLGAFEFRG